jgi:hypothetical protein
MPSAEYPAVAVKILVTVSRLELVMIVSPAVSGNNVARWAMAVEAIPTITAISMRNFFIADILKSAADKDRCYW